MSETVLNKPLNPDFKFALAEIVMTWCLFIDVLITDTLDLMIVLIALKGRSCLHQMLLGDL